MNQAPEHGPSAVFLRPFSANIFLVSTVTKLSYGFVLPILCQNWVFVFQLYFLSRFFCDCVTCLCLTLLNFFSVAHYPVFTGRTFKYCFHYYGYDLPVMKQDDTVELKLRIQVGLSCSGYQLVPVSTFSLYFFSWLLLSYRPSPIWKVFSADYMSYAKWVNFVKHSCMGTLKIIKCNWI